MATWDRDVLTRTTTAFRGMHNTHRAEGAAAYMKHIAPFIGISAPDRRAALKPAWKDLRLPSSDELGAAALRLMEQTEREYHYAAYDLIEKYIDQADDYFLAEYLEPLITTTPWWDTVDGFVSVGVSPLCWRYDATAIINEWSESANIWLIRAAIGHQRGWKRNADIDRVFELCDRHWQNKEFFIAKAIGWALRDITAFNPHAVQRFIIEHPWKNSVALREANRGIERALKTRG